VQPGCRAALLHLRALHLTGGAMRSDLFQRSKTSPRPYVWLRRLSMLAVPSASEGVGVVFFSSLMFLRSDNRQRSSALNGMSSVRATHLPLGSAERGSGSLIIFKAVTGDHRDVIRSAILAAKPATPQFYPIKTLCSARRVPGYPAAQGSSFFSRGARCAGVHTIDC
jgi:hypothetical protein